MKVKIANKCEHCNSDHAELVELSRYIREICVDKASGEITVDRISKMLGLVINELCDNCVISNAKITEVLHEMTHDKTITVT